MSEDEDGGGSVLYSDPYSDSEVARRTSSGSGGGGGFWGGGGRLSGGGGRIAAERGEGGPPSISAGPLSDLGDGDDGATLSDGLTDPLDDFLARYTCDVVPDVVVGKLKKR
jgi:hypothetical protein